MLTRPRQLTRRLRQYRQETFIKGTYTLATFTAHDSATPIPWTIVHPPTESYAECFESLIRWTKFKKSFFLRIECVIETDSGCAVHYDVFHSDL